MKEALELYQKLRSLGDKGLGVVSIGTIKSVDKENSRCVADVDGLEISDVRLKATMNGEKGFKIFPTPGSTVLIERISDGQFVVQMMSEVEGVELHIGNKKFELDKAGCLIANQSDSLLDVINLIIEAVQVIVVMQGKGPDLAKLIQAKTKVETILK
ncbi:hypothetical protein ABDK00_001665 [Niabella insulamsoli]|uniref:hypothetical protein n=1 Tax=Niabella insulamsoli TaxID=3144874 RepID=UPI0031FC26E9